MKAADLTDAWIGRTVAVHHTRPPLVGRLTAVPGMPVTSRVRLADGRSARLPTDPRLARDAHSAQEDT